MTDFRAAALDLLGISGPELEELVHILQSRAQLQKLEELTALLALLRCKRTCDDEDADAEEMAKIIRQDDDPPPPTTATVTSLMRVIWNSRWGAAPHRVWPLEPFSACDERCVTNHSQTAVELACRGGVCPSEAVAILSDLPLRSVAHDAGSQQQMAQRVAAILDQRMPDWKLRVGIERR